MFRVNDPWSCWVVFRPPLGGCGFRAENVSLLAGVWLFKRIKVDRDVEVSR